MGIPKFYRWLSERYPLINQKIDGPICPEFDCLYLDMNGIFHTATHGPNAIQTTDMRQQFAEICKYILRLVSLIKPKKLLYLAVDGVAPRAKQNQQRKRRFVAAQEAKQIETSQNRENHPRHFDSNCITPGTEWMEHLSTEIRSFIQKEMENNISWKSLAIIYSDHLVPGEGEHKIMAYIRHMKMQSDYNPNTRHCIYGLDADLIMLSLVSHEPHFALLREEVIFGLDQQTKRIRENAKMLVKKDSFQLLHISVLRDYIHLEFSQLKDLLKMEYSLERIIDDIVFVCMFVGNDFIPHIPSIDIATGGIQKLFDCYRELILEIDDYITHHGVIDVKRTILLFNKMERYEQDAFQEQIAFLRKHYNQIYRNRLMVADNLNDEVKNGGDIDNKDEPQDMDDNLIEDDDLAPHLSKIHEPTIDEIDIQLDLLENDWSGFKQKYYNDRWQDGRMNDEKSRHQLCMDYIMSMQWILSYYYNGCCSWGWYYPHHYPPLISDMKDLSSNLVIKFTLGVPYLPFTQLLSVLPIASNHLLPHVYRDLMANTESPIHKMYPLEFEIDMDFATTPWEGIALLPFIDENTLLNTLKTIDESKLTHKEQLRNCVHQAEMYSYDAVLAAEPKQKKSTGETSYCVKQTPFELPPITANNGNFLPLPLKNCQYPLEGFPQFNQKLLEFDTRLQKIPCRIFGLASKYQTFVISIKNDPISKILSIPDDNKNDNESPNRNKYMHDKTNDQNLLISDENNDYEQNLMMSDKHLNEIDRYIHEVMQEGTIFIEWPFLREGKIVDVSTSYKRYYYKTMYNNYDDDNDDNNNDNNNNKLSSSLRPFSQQSTRKIIWDYLKNNDIEEFDKKCDEVAKNILDMQGIEVGPIYALIKILPLKGMKRTKNKIIKQWHNLNNENKYDEITLPLQLIFLKNNNYNNNIIIDHRFIDRDVNLKQELQPGAPVMYIGPGERYFGKYGRVLQYPTFPDNEVKKKTIEEKADIRILLKFEHKNFARDVISQFPKLKYCHLRKAVNFANIDSMILSRILGNVIIHNPPNDIDIGLNIKLGHQGKIIPGYARGVEKMDENGNKFNDIQISERAIEIVQKYREAFPGVFNVLAAHIHEKHFQLNWFAPNNIPQISTHEYLRPFELEQEIDDKKLDLYHKTITDVLSKASAKKKQEKKLKISQNMNENDTDNNLHIKTNNENDETVNNYDNEDIKSRKKKTDKMLRELQKDVGSILIDDNADEFDSETDDDDIASSAPSAGNTNINDQNTKNDENIANIDENDDKNLTIDNTKSPVLIENDIENNDDNDNNEDVTEIKKTKDQSFSELGQSLINDTKDVVEDEKKITPLSTFATNSRVLSSSAAISLGLQNAVDEVLDKTSKIKFEEIEAHASEMCKEKDAGLKYILSVINWLHALPLYKLPLIDINARVLTEDIIQAIEKEADKYYEESKKQKPKAVQMKLVPVEHIYAADPAIPWSPSPQSSYQLGDRVSSLRSDQGVPFGTLGSVVGVHETFLEIISDRETTAGTTLHSRCSNNRGLMLSYDNIINLSYFHVTHHQLKSNDVDNQQQNLSQTHAKWQYPYDDNQYHQKRRNYNYNYKAEHYYQPIDHDSEQQAWIPDDSSNMQSFPQHSQQKHYNTTVHSILNEDDDINQQSYTQSLEQATTQPKFKMKVYRAVPSPNENIDQHWNTHSANKPSHYHARQQDLYYEDNNTSVHHKRRIDYHRHKDTQENNINANINMGNNKLPNNVPMKIPYDYYGPPMTNAPMPSQNSHARRKPNRSFNNAQYRSKRELRFRGTGYGFSPLMSNNNDYNPNSSPMTNRRKTSNIPSRRPTKPTN